MGDATRQQQAHPPRKRGRPGALGDLPGDTRHRSIRLTDAEWDAVRALVRKMRAAGGGKRAK